MKTHEIMTKYEYQSVGGLIDAVPVSDVLKFCQRIKDRLDDVVGNDAINVYREIEETILQLEHFEIDQEGFSPDVAETYLLAL